MGQIMLAGANAEQDPAAVADSFGKAAIIDELGVPPTYEPAKVHDLIESSRHSNDWLDAAYGIMRQIEPAAEGLLIDR